MADELTPRLRGNIFFLFLLRAAKQKLGVAPSWGTSTQGLTQTQLFMALMQTVDPTYQVPNEGTLRQYISQYLKGDRPDSPTYYPFKTPSFQSGALLYLKDHRSDAIRKMDALCSKFLDTDNEATRKLLVGGLVALILKDGSIPGNTPFDTGYKEATRAELAQETDFILQPFLVSVWGYIVTKKPDAKEGAETYMAWTEDAGGGNPRRITTRWGTNMAKKIAVSTDLPEEMLAETANKDENTDEKPADEEKTVEAEELPRVEVYEAPYTDPLTQKQVLAQFHVEARDNGIAIGQVFGGLVIGKRGGKDE